MKIIKILIKIVFNQKKTIEFEFISTININRLE